MSKKRGSGLVLTSHHPKIGFFALLSRRGTFNWEKMEPESFPGACQVSSHGGLEGEESFRDGLFREAGQELGPSLEAELRRREADLKEVGHKNDERAEVITEGLHVDYAVIEAIFAERGMEKFVPCTAEQARNIRVLDPKNKEEREKGVTDHGIAMFDDEMSSVCNALEDVVGS